MHHTTELIFSGLGIIGFLLAATEIPPGDIPSQVMADSMILAWCLAGSFAATMLYALMYPPGPENPRGIWPTAVANFIFGSMLGPMVTQWIAPKVGLNVSLHTCLGIAGILSMSCTWALKQAAPKLGNRILAMIDSVEFLSWLRSAVFKFKSTDEIKEERKEVKKEIVKENIVDLVPVIVQEVKKRESDVIDPNAPGALDKPTGL